MNSEANYRSQPQSFRTPVSIQLLLLLTLISGFGLRVWNINFDEGVGSHPDERSTSCFYAPTIHLPESWAQFQDPTQSPLNPLWSIDRQERRSFTYGHFPLYLGVGMANLFPKVAPLAERVGAPDEALRILTNGNTICEGFAVAGRLTIALLDTLTILLIYLLGRRLGSFWDAKVGRRRGSPVLGLMAAAFYAFTAQAIQLSHFFAMDPASTTFTVLAVLGGVMMVQDKSLSACLITGLGVGLAIASKFSALPIIVLPIVALLLVMREGNNADPDEDELNASKHAGDAYAQVRIIYGAIGSLIVAAIAFLVTSPYAVLDWQNFIQATLVEQGRMVRGIADMPFTRQYRNTTPYLYFIDQQIRWGLWWPLGLLSAAGTLFMLVRLVRSLWIYLAGDDWGRLDDRQNANILIWAWILPYFGLTGAFLAKFNRYMSPILPFVVLFGAALIWYLWRRWQEGENRGFLIIKRILALLLVTAGVGGGLFWSAAYVNGVYNSEHPWITASRWAYENVPSGSVILWELWDDPIPKSIPGEPGMDMGSTGLRHIDWSPYEDENVEKYEVLKQKLREADYVAYSSKRIYDSVDELPERYPMTTLYYDGMWDGSLGYEVAFDISTPPALLGYTFEDRKGADESWSLYDHPQVTIFRKVRDLSDAEFDAYFQNAWEEAIWGYRGKDSPLSPLLEIIGLGSSHESEKSGLINRIISFATDEDHGPPPLPSPEERTSLMLEQPVDQLPVVDNYRWNQDASDNPLLAIVWWWGRYYVAGLAGMAYLFCYLHAAARPRLFLCSRGWLVAERLAALVDCQFGLGDELGGQRMADCAIAGYCGGNFCGWPAPCYGRIPLQALGTSGGWRGSLCCGLFALCLYPFE